MMSPPAAIEAPGDSAPIDGFMLIGAMDAGAMDSGAIDPGAIDAGAVLSGDIDAAAIDGAMLAAIEAAALAAAPPLGALVPAGELVLPLLHADATNRPVRDSAPTEVNFIQGLLRNHDGSA